MSVATASTKGRAAKRSRSRALQTWKPDFRWQFLHVVSVEVERLQIVGTASARASRSDLIDTSAPRLSSTCMLAPRSWSQSGIWLVASEVVSVLERPANDGPTAWQLWRQSSVGAVALRVSLPKCRRGPSWRDQGSISINARATDFAVSTFSACRMWRKARMR